MKTIRMNGMTDHDILNGFGRGFSNGFTETLNSTLASIIGSAPDSDR